MSLRLAWPHSEFQDTRGYRERICLRKGGVVGRKDTKRGTTAQMCSLSAGEVEKGGSLELSGQSNQTSMSLPEGQTLS